MDIVPDSVLLACQSHRESEFQGGHRPCRLHERLLGDVPCEGSGREESPAVIPGELAGSVASGCEGEDIAGIQRVVDPAVEGDEIVLVAVPQITGLRRLTRIEVDLVGDVEICDVAARPVVVLPGVAGQKVQIVDSPGLVVVGIGLKQLAAAYVHSLRVFADTQVVSVGVCLEGTRADSVV